MGWGARCSSVVRAFAHGTMGWVVRSILHGVDPLSYFLLGATCSSMVGASAHGAMGRWIDPSWGGPIDRFLVPASAPRLV